MLPDPFESFLYKNFFDSYIAKQNKISLQIQLKKDETKQSADPLK